MKKLLLAMLFLLCLTACGANEPAAENNGPTAAPTPETATTLAAAAPTTAAQNTDGFVFESNGEKIYMDENMAEVLTKLGEPNKTFEAPSCAFDGIDRIFGYPGFEVHTYPEDGNDFVHTVYFNDDSVSTPEGIYLGSTLDDMVSAYGEDYVEELGQYTYTKGKTHLSFLLEEGVIEAITYSLEM